MRVRTFHMDSSVVVTVLALSFYWAGAASMKYGNFSNYDLIIAGANPAFMQLAGSAGLTLTLLCASLFPGLFIGRYTRTMLQIAPFFLGLPSAIFLTLSQFDASISVELIFISRTLFMLGNGCILVQAGYCLSRQPAVTGAISFSISYLIGALIALSVENMSAIPGAIICTLFVWVAALFTTLIPIGELLSKEGGDDSPVSDQHSKKPQRLVFLLQNDQKEGIGTSPNMPKKFLNLFLGLLFYSSLFGVATVLTLRTQTALHFTLPFSALLLFSCSVVVLLIIKFGRYLDLEMIQWFLFVPIIIGLIPLLFSNFFISYVCCAILVISFTCYDVSNLIILSGLTRNYSSRVAVRMFALGRAANTIGMLIGSIVMMFVTDGSFRDEQAALQVVVFLACLFLVAGMAFLGRSAFNKEISPPEQLSTRKGRWQMACDDIVKSSELSEREQEVFSYLSKGRNSEYISEQLYIAPSTVKTYIRRIYQKLDVHSQQELLSVIDERVKKYEEKSK